MASFWYTGQFFIYGSSKFVKSAWEDASKNFTEDLSKVFTLFLGLLWDSGFLVPEKWWPALPSFPLFLTVCTHLTLLARQTWRANLSLSLGPTVELATVLLNTWLLVEELSTCCAEAKNVESRLWTKSRPKSTMIIVMFTFICAMSVSRRRLSNSSMISRQISRVWMFWYVTVDVVGLFVFFPLCLL